MCGLVGIAGNLAYKDEKAMKRLLLLDFFRGVDSTGLAAIRHSNKEALIAKLPSHPLDLFEMPKFKSALNGQASSVFIGHNRAATKGAVNNYNAHPFTFGHITGAHNGTLDHFAFTDLKKELKIDYPVDSQAIFAAIAKMGIKDTMAIITGAWSLVWYDSQDDTLNFLRNKERPLWYAFTKEFDRIFWASEWPMIDGAVKLADHGQQYDLYTEEKTYHRFWATEENVHIKYDLKELRAGAKTMLEAIETVVKGRETTVAKGPEYDPFNRAGGSSTKPSQTVLQLRSPSPIIVNGTGTGSSTSTTRSPSDSAPIVVKLIGGGDDPYAGVIDEARFRDLARHGCDGCTRPIAWGDQGVTIYDRDDLILCPMCTDPSGGEAKTRVYTTEDVRKLLQ